MPPGSNDRPAAQRAFDSQSSDHRLVRLLRGGDERAAEALYRRYVRRVHALIAGQMPNRLAPRLSPDDIAQSVFRVFFTASPKRRTTSRTTANFGDCCAPWR